jgi:hypothetical protein
VVEGQVVGDREEPGLEASGVAQPLPPLPGAHEGHLREVLGREGVTHSACHEVVDAPQVTVVDSGERRFVTVTERLPEL